MFPKRRGWNKGLIELNMKNMLAIVCSKLSDRLEGHDAEINPHVWMWKPTLFKVVEFDIYETSRWLWFSVDVRLMQLELTFHRSFHDMLIRYDKWDRLIAVQLVIIEKSSA